VLGVTHASTPVAPEAVERIPQNANTTFAELPPADAAAAVERPEASAQASLTAESDPQTT
jgi:hypothetical protein